MPPTSIPNPHPTIPPRTLSRQPVGLGSKIQCLMTDSVVSPDWKPQLVEFNDGDGDEDKAQPDLSTFTILNPPKRVTSLLVSTPVDQIRSNQTINSFLVRYNLDKRARGPWKTFKDPTSQKDKLFKPLPSSYFQALPLFLPKPISFLRIVPKTWSGTNPQMLVDILGC